jgi:hypothetical protein
MEGDDVFSTAEVNQLEKRGGRMGSKAKSCILLLGLMLLTGSGAQAWADDGWTVGLFGGLANYDTLKDVFYEDYADSYMAALLVGKHLTGYKHYLSLGGEGQIAKHWGDQDHWEFNGLLIVRWLPFPWDHYLDTSFAVGEGLSYASEDPEIELEKHDRTSKLLNYLMFELAFVVPRQPQWTLFARIHHRSGVFGLFDGMSGGSNVVGGGLRYAF